MQRTVPPEGTNLVLSSDVPNSERDVLVLDSLDVEAWGLAMYRMIRNPSPRMIR